MFRHYDRADYSRKTRVELMRQLKNQITIFKTSKIVWDAENPGVQWRLPENFNSQQASSFLEEARQVFAGLKDEELSQMTEDVARVLQGDTGSLYSEKMTFSSAQNSFDRNSFVQNSMFASKQMNDRAE